MADAFHKILRVCHQREKEEEKEKGEKGEKGEVFDDGELNKNFKQNGALK